MNVQTATNTWECSTMEDVRSAESTVAVHLIQRARTIIVELIEQNNGSVGERTKPLVLKTSVSPHKSTVRSNRTVSAKSMKIISTPQRLISIPKVITEIHGKTCKCGNVMTFTQPYAQFTGCQQARFKMGIRFEHGSTITLKCANDGDFAEWDCLQSYDSTPPCFILWRRSAKALECSSCHCIHRRTSFKKAAVPKEP